MKTRIDAVHPVLMCRDVPAAVRFFEALGFSLGFDDGEAVPRYARVVRDGVELHLQWHDESQFTVPGDRPAYRFLVRDVEALHEELRAAGALPEAPEDAGPWGTPGDTPWGTREFHLRDPSGNLLQLYRPSSSIRK
jgi:catechol 2,3-dioxygenase-like lactoylglutathione lyase family enzyme